MIFLVSGSSSDFNVYCNLAADNTQTKVKLRFIVEAAELTFSSRYDSNHNDEEWFKSGPTGKVG